MTVLQRNELEKSPLADLHAIASELGVEGFRGLRRDDLVSAIVGAQGGDDSADDSDAGDTKDDGGDDAPRRSRGGGGGGGRSRSRRGGRSRGPKNGDDDSSADTQAESRSDSDDDDGDDSDREQVSGVLDVLPNGSGFLRGEGDDGDHPYVSAAQIRRCELRGGDQVTGRMRPARRNEKHPSLVRVEQVNGRDAEPPEERPLFSDLTAVHPTDKLPVPAALESIGIGKGSRVAVAGGPGAGATRLLHEFVDSLTGAGGDLTVSVALVGVRPEEVTDWKRADGDVPVVGGSFDGSVEAQTQAAELAVEQAKRAAERGGDAVVVIDSLESLPAGAARRLFGAARKLEEGGSLTVVAATGMAWEPQRQASTRIALDGPADDGAVQVSTARSGTMRGDLIS